MTATSDSTAKHTDRRRTGMCGSSGNCRGNWSGTNIAAMVIGFVLFWPVGLFLLYWIVTGRHVRELPGAIRRQFERAVGGWDGSRNGAHGDSGNTVFNEYQQTQLDRIREIREEVKERARRFKAFRADARRRADREEFDRFMSSTPPRTDG